MFYFIHSACLCLCVLLCSFTGGSAQATKCYACHGESCNDPLNKRNTPTMLCSDPSPINIEGVANSNAYAGSNFHDEGSSLEDKLKSAEANVAQEYVCVKSFYYSYAQQKDLTIRRCMPKSYNHMNGCYYLSSIINGGIGKVQLCTWCETSLCNSGNTPMGSVLAVVIFCLVKLLAYN